MPSVGLVVPTVVRRRLGAVLRSLVCMALLAFPAFAFGRRKTVLPQIDLPHSYYYRELYLPQLTSGPGAVAWSPDGQEVPRARVRSQNAR